MRTNESDCDSNGQSIRCGSFGRVVRSFAAGGFATLVICKRCQRPPLRPIAKPINTKKLVPNLPSSQSPNRPGSTISRETVVILATHSMASAIGGFFGAGAVKLIPPPRAHCKQTKPSELGARPTKTQHAAKSNRPRGSVSLRRLSERVLLRSGRLKEVDPSARSRAECDLKTGPNRAASTECGWFLTLRVCNLRTMRSAVNQSASKFVFFFTKSASAL